MLAIHSMIAIDDVSYDEGTNDSNETDLINCLPDCIAFSAA
jgi:hypothetical protein